MLSIEQLRTRWLGVVIPLITPFREDGSPDLTALGNNVQWIIDKGACIGNTVFLAGGSGGDLTSMTTDERKQVMKTVCDISNGQVPVMASSQSTDVRVCIELCQFGEEVGLDAVQISGPYYYEGRPGDALAWMQRVAQHTEMGFAVYNNWYTGYDMPLDLVDEILEIPNSIAVKWGSPDKSIFLEGVRRFNTKAVVVNNGGWVELTYPMGVHCHISHLPNFYPEHSWRVHELFMAGKQEEAEAEWERCMVPWRDLIAPIRAVTGGEGVFVRPAMELVGLKGGHSPLPSRDEVVTPELREEYRQLLTTWQAI